MTLLLTSEKTKLLPTPDLQPNIAENIGTETKSLIGKGDSRSLNLNAQMTRDPKLVTMERTNTTSPK